MSFSASKTGENVVGNMRCIYGTYSQGNTDTGGEIDTGLSDIKNFFATAASKHTVSGGVVTIVTPDPTADIVGFWRAEGY